MRTLLYLLSFISFGALAQKPSAIINDDWSGIDWYITGGQNLYYDNNEQETVQISKFYNEGTDSWVDDERITSYYNPSGQITSKYFAQGIATFPDTTRRIVFEYNSYGQLITETGQSYFPGYWENLQRTVNTYSSSVGDIHTQEFQYWDDALEQWIPISKKEFNYNSNQTQWDYYIWDNSQWNLSDRTTITFNQNEKPLEELNEAWSGVSWNPGSKISYSYTNFGEISGASTRYYSTDEQDYIYGDSIRYSYNSNQTINNTVFIIYDNQFHVWSNVRRSRYFYDTQLTVAEELESTFLVYPNPASNVINTSTHKMGSVKIIDQNGMILKSFDEMNTNTIDISDLTPGIYFIQLQTDEEFISKSFVKR